MILLESMALGSRSHESGQVDRRPISMMAHPAEAADC